MNAALVFSLIGSAGFLAGVAAIFQFLNTRKSTRTKSGADAYRAYQEFVHGATDDRDREIARITASRDKYSGVVDLLIDLVQDLILYARGRGVLIEELEPFQDRLDSARRK